MISIHALREESDVTAEAFINSTKNFNPRSPRGERPDDTYIKLSEMDFNPRSPRGERH